MIVGSQRPAPQTKPTGSRHLPFHGPRSLRQGFMCTIMPDHVLHVRDGNAGIAKLGIHSNSSSGGRGMYLAALTHASYSMRRRGDGCSCWAPTTCERSGTGTERICAVTRRPAGMRNRCRMRCLCRQSASGNAAYHHVRISSKFSPVSCERHSDWCAASIRLMSDDCHSQGLNLMCSPQKPF